MLTLSAAAILTERVATALLFAEAGFRASSKASRGQRRESTAPGTYGASTALSIAIAA